MIVVLLSTPLQIAHAIIRFDLIFVIDEGEVFRVRDKRFRNKAMNVYVLALPIPAIQGHSIIAISGDAMFQDSKGLHLNVADIAEVTHLIKPSVALHVSPNFTHRYYLLSQMGLPWKWVQNPPGQVLCNPTSAGTPCSARQHPSGH